MTLTETTHECIHRGKVGGGSPRNVAHIIFEGNSQQEQVIRLTQNRLIQTLDHICHKKTGNTQMPRTCDNIVDALPGHIQMSLFKKNEWETVCFVFDLPLA